MSLELIVREVIQKFNPSHDEQGRFAEGDSGSLGAFKPADQIRQTEQSMSADELSSAKEQEKRENAIGQQVLGASPIAQRNAADEYMGSAYVDMNPALRAGMKIRAGSDSANLQTLISRWPPTQRDMVLYRHMEDFPQKLPNPGENAKILGFTSACTIPQGAYLAPKDGVSFEISVPKGSTGVAYGINPIEHEAIIKHGAVMKYLGTKTVSYDAGDEVLPNTTHFFEYVG